MIRIFAIVKDGKYLCQTSETGWSIHFGVNCLYFNEKDVRDTARRINGEVLVFEIDPENPSE